MTFMTHIKRELLKFEKSRFSTLIKENSDSAENSDRKHTLITRMITKSERRRIDKKKLNTSIRKELFAFDY
jgi:hypothetical protein